jgi:hypothetical protein
VPPSLTQALPVRRANPPDTDCRTIGVLNGRFLTAKRARELTPVDRPPLQQLNRTYLYLSDRSKIKLSFAFRVISPILANVYLHEVLDEWFARQVALRLAGRAILVRYADDRAPRRRGKEALMGTRSSVAAREMRAAPSKPVC